MSTVGRVAAFVGGLLLVAALIVGIWALAFGISWFTAGPNGKLQARQTILSGDNRIAQYEQFFNLCQSAQVAEEAIKSQKAELAQLPKSDKQDRVNTLTNISANEITRQDAVTQYNVNATKSYNEGQFRSSNLPYQLPVTIPEGGTQCRIY